MLKTMLSFLEAYFFFFIFYILSIFLNFYRNYVLQVRKNEEGEINVRELFAENVYCVISDLRVFLIGVVVFTVVLFRSIQ